MLAKRVSALPEGEGLIFEPKWDGFRTLVFKDGTELPLQSRDEKPLNRYSPELVARSRQRYPNASCSTGSWSSRKTTHWISTRCRCDYTPRPRGSLCWHVRRRLRSCSSTS